MSSGSNERTLRELLAEVLGVCDALGPHAEGILRIPVTYPFSLLWTDVCLGVTGYCWLSEAQCRYIFIRL